MIKIWKKFERKIEIFKFQILEGFLQFDRRRSKSKTEETRLVVVRRLF